jgi:hypothetical protein
MMKEISTHILDISAQCISSGATNVSIEINAEPANDLLTIVFECNCNQKQDLAFARPAKKPVANIPYLEQACSRCGGHLTIQKSEACGLPFERLAATMQYHHLERPPMGDILSAMQSLFVSNQAVSIKYVHRVNGRQYRVSTSELLAVLDGVPLETPSVSKWIKESMGAGLEAIMQPEVSL